jgi:hypothetical protein
MTAIEDLRSQSAKVDHPHPATVAFIEGIATQLDIAATHGDLSAVRNLANELRLSSGDIARDLVKDDPPAPEHVPEPHQTDPDAVEHVDPSTTIPGLEPAGRW